MRELIAINDEEVLGLASCHLVTGHLSVPTLLRIAPASHIATVLREPRARLLSFYAFWRLTPNVGAAWLPYDAVDQALRPLDDMLGDPKLAAVTDNLICRMLLFGDRRLPSASFIAPGDVEEVAAAANEQVDALGFAGVLEAPGTWEGFAEFFQIASEPVRVNVTGAAGSRADATTPISAISSHMLELIEQRSSADAIVYRHALTRLGVDAASHHKVERAAYATELLRLGNAAGSCAAERARLMSALATARGEAERRRQEQEIIAAELSRHQAWLSGMTRSASWRLTAPLRSAKRALSR